MKKPFLQPIAHLAGLIFSTFFLIYITNHFLLTVDFYDRSGQPISLMPGQAVKLYSTLQHWIYLYSILYLLIKLFAIIIIINTILFINTLYVTIGSVVQIIITAEYLFLIPAVIKFIVFYCKKAHYGLLEWYHYYPLAVISFFPKASAGWIYPLQTLNLFELAYCLLLARLLSRLTATTFNHVLAIIFKSYVPLLMLWMIVVAAGTMIMFPTLN